MQRFPQLDDRCGRQFRYRDLIECGKTWTDAAAQGLAIDNSPLRLETYAAMRDLCCKILDPLSDLLGVPRLTYGFASPRLTARIRRQISPHLDQHASCELDEGGAPICPRLGAAVDLIFPDRSSRDVARRIVVELDFDRLYFYGDDRPVHVSAGPEHRRGIVLMERGPSGRLLPRNVGPNEL